MKRYYFVRDQRIDVEEIENVVAVRVASDREGKPRVTSRAFGTSAKEALRGDAEEILSEETAEAFTKANWVFVKPSKGLSEAMSRGERPADAEMVGKVIRRRKGTFAVVTSRLNVQLKPELTEEECSEILAELDLEMVNTLRFAPNFFEVDARNRPDSLDASVELHEDDRIILAEPSFIEHIPQRLTPTDPDYGDQWQWNNTGANGGTAGADVNIEPAWDHTLGAGLRVAVIDNGFDADHEDLVAGVVGESGYFEVSGGNTVFTQGVAGMPGGRHGTFCAGMAGARHNNGNGGCGAAPESDLMLIACLVDQTGTQTTLARAVAYAGDPSIEVTGANPTDGADILVCSLGPNGAVWELTATLELAIEGAAANGRGGRGLAIFWAASNGRNVDVMDDEVVSHDDVIAVVRSDRNDQEDNTARGDAVELIAPGVDVYSTRPDDTYGTGTGTSYAAPCAAGCAALALSTNPDLTRDELRQIMRDTADQIGGVVYDANGHNDDYGFGRVNAEAAVLEAARRVTLETASVVFNDVPEGETTARAVVWQCFGLEPLTFQVVSGPGSPFGILLGSSVTIPAPGITSGAKARLWLSFTGTTAGDTAAGTVRVRCVETGEEWDVPLSANTVARPKTAVVLVLDQSGSMDWDAGDGRKREEVLREAAHNFVDVIQPENGIGIVRFDHDAYPGMPVTEAGPEIFGAGRAAASAAIAAHTANPAGATSIGDGVELAGTQLDAVTGYDHTAMIVLTDGQENAEKSIADVAGSIDDHVFAIGLGTPEVVNPDALNALTNGAGGYVVMTGNLSADEYFVLSKYYLQILAGVTNQEIVVDPDGYLRPGQGQKIPFVLNEADAGADVILLSPGPAVLRFALITPDGEMIHPRALPPGVKYVTGKGVIYYRFNLPVVSVSGKAWAGKWTALLECDRREFKIYLDHLEKTDPKAYELAAAHGVRYSLEVQARSSLRLAAEVHQKSIDAGTSIVLQAQLSEYGLPVEDRAKVRVELTAPGGTGQLELQETTPGAFRGEIEGDRHGTYRFRIVAAGKTLRGNSFTREQTLTASVYVPKPPEEDPRPPQDDDDHDRPPLPPECVKLIKVLLEVLSRDRRLAKLLAEALKRMGVELSAVIKCLTRILGRQPPLHPIGRDGIVVPVSDGPDHRAIAENLRAIADSLDDGEPG